jgi:hypothetical protein
MVLRIFGDLTAVAGGIAISPGLCPDRTLSGADRRRSSPRFSACLEPFIGPLIFFSADGHLWPCTAAGAI